VFKTVVEWFAAALVGLFAGLGAGIVIGFVIVRVKRWVRRRRTHV